jgi:diguanylate cyclase (GGDEF)-like protein
MKILIVDNARLFHQIIGRVFADAGLQPESAENGAAALDRLAAGDIDVVCSSYYLSDMTGIELCRRVRTTPNGRYAPFILFTAQQPVEVVRDAYIAGVTDVFEKQALDRLLTFIQRLLAQSDPIHGRVLVVEDSATQGEIYASIFLRHGLEVELAATAEEALERVRNADFDLVLTDIVLGGPMSGVTLVNQIRRLDSHRGEVPILATTAFDDPARRIELFRLGVNDYVQKPVAEEELIARTRNVISHFHLLRHFRMARVEAEAQREHAYSELSWRASHDALTELANRWAFEQRLGAILADPATAARHGLALIDVASLRVVNDTGGHDAGDALMREIGLRLRLAMPPHTFAARLEGGRLGVLVTDATPAAIGRAISLLLEAIENEHFQWNEGRYPVRAQAGAVTSLAGIHGINEALSRAETANAAAHTSGASEILIYDEDDERIAVRQREKRTLPALLGALDGEHFVLHRQRIEPLRENAGGNGYEFLCRMIDRDGSLRLPGEFLPAAERYGLMPRLDRLVTKFALEWMAAHHQRHPDSRFYTINLSGQTLSDVAFAEFVREELARTGAPAGKVYFEITETAVMANVETALAFMSAMSELGCRFALDDFGSGTASYGQLKQLPVQMVKIDGGFVRGMMTNPLDLAIIRSTCEVARVMQLITIAEFIETAEETRQLAALGVDYGQGYVLGRPEPLPE